MTLLVIFYEQKISPGGKTWAASNYMPAVL